MSSLRILVPIKRVIDYAVRANSLRYRTGAALFLPQ